MAEQFDLDMERVLVTGASSGLGEVVAETFAEAGHDVFVTGRDPERTAQVAGRLGCEYALADLSRGSEAQRVVHEAVTAFGGLTAVVNCAGAKVDTLDQKGWLTELQPEDIDTMVQANFTGLMKLAQAARSPLEDGFRARRAADPNLQVGAHFISIGSSVYRQPYESHPAYAACQSGKANFMDNIGRHWLRSGIAAVTFDIGALALNMRSPSGQKQDRPSGLALADVAERTVQMATSRSNAVELTVLMHAASNFLGTEPR